MLLKNSSNVKTVEATKWILLHYIHLVDLRTAEPLLKYEIGKNGRILYEVEPGIFERYALFYIKKFYELKDYFDYEIKISNT